MAEYTPRDGLPNTGAPAANSKKRKRRAPSPKQWKDRQTSASTEVDAPSRRPSQRPQNARNRHNIASQIRSLEKLLKHPGARMTANVRQEKGRELAALVLERERKKAKSRARKNLGKYHMVRFVERQKCERILRGLRKQMHQIQESRSLARKKAKARRRAKVNIEDSDTDMDADGGLVLPDSKEVIAEAKIKQAEVDLNYTIYAPLREKYISLFPPTGRERIPGISRQSKSFLGPEEEAEVRRLKDDNFVRTATGEKPPMWFRVQNCMQNGTLEQLRDSELTTTGSITLPQISSKIKTKQRRKDTPDWLRDNCATPAEDLDSDEGSDEDEQKIDGGFFEET